MLSHSFQNISSTTDFWICPSCSSKDFLSRLYFTLHRLVTWGSAAATYIERLSKLQKRAARIILHAEFNAPSEHMFKELCWLSVPDRLRYNKAVLTYRAVNNLTPEYLSSLLKPVSQVHNFNLRSSENGFLFVPKTRTALCDGIFSCSAPRLWNALPRSTREANSLNAFKNNLKSYLRT